MRACSVAELVDFSVASYLLLLESHAMRGPSRYLLLATTLLLSIYLLYSYVLHVADDILIISDKQDPHSDSQQKQPKITIIAIWDSRSDETPIYLPYFFYSVKANPEVDLLFIQVDKLNAGCKTYSKARNVQVSRFGLCKIPIAC